VRFFFDNNLPPKLAKSLHVLVEPHHQVVHLKQKFAANATDETWMLDLAKEEDWVIISGDLRIRKNPHEIAAWRSAGHTTFFLKPGWINLPFLDSNVEICEMLSGHPSNCGKSKEGRRVLRINQWQDREVARATFSNLKRFRRIGIARLGGLRRFRRRYLGFAFFFLCSSALRHLVIRSPA
jgi:hypothetical protein